MKKNNLGTNSFKEIKGKALDTRFAQMHILNEKRFRSYIILHKSLIRLIFSPIVFDFTALAKK